MKNFILELYYRIGQKSPDTFKKLRTVCLSISAVCTMLTQNGLDFQIFGVDVAKITAIFTAGAAIMTFLTVHDADALNKKLDK